MRRSLGARSGISNSIGLVLMKIEAGKFLMGSPDNECTRPAEQETFFWPFDDHVSEREPQHQVQITRPFFIGATEVTQQQWAAVMGNYRSSTDYGRRMPLGPDLPVEVTWAQATEFCARLTAKEHRQYRLPTEAEWEYACRAGTLTAFNTGQVLTADYACFGKAGQGGACEVAPVASYPPNHWGLYDMHGNVWEWCIDGKRDYDSGVQKVDPIGPIPSKEHVARGGAWSSSPVNCRSAKCKCQSSGENGFRIVWDVSGFGDLEGDSLPDW